jgi:hypothetical protein
MPLRRNNLQRVKILVAPMVAPANRNWTILLPIYTVGFRTKTAADLPKCSPTRAKPDAISEWESSRTLGASHRHRTTPSRPARTRTIADNAEVTPLLEIGGATVGAVHAQNEPLGAWFDACPVDLSDEQREAIQRTVVGR